MKIVIIYGPTVVGKTNIAIGLAKRLHGELISADSRQVYKNLDIGTGKVSFDSQIEKHNGYWVVDGVKIHCFDIVSPGQHFTAMDFLKEAQRSINQIESKGKLPIIVGGTGFYIKALSEGLDTAGIGPDPKLRQKLEKLSAKELFDHLTSIDPLKAKSLNESDSKNPRRLVRAIEIAQASLTPGVSKVSKVASRHTPGVFLIIGLTAPNQFLYQKADKWLNTRLDHGMVEEVQNLLEQKINPKWLENLGLEYRWITRYLLGKIPKEQAVARLKGDIHDFIRRQKTWFKNLNNIRLFDVTEQNFLQKLEKTIEAMVNSKR